MKMCEIKKNIDLDVFKFHKHFAIKQTFKWASNCCRYQIQDKQEGERKESSEKLGQNVIENSGKYFVRTPFVFPATGYLECSTAGSKKLF